MQVMSTEVAIGYALLLNLSSSSKRVEHRRHGYGLGRFIEIYAFSTLIRICDVCMNEK